MKAIWKTSGRVGLALLATAALALATTTPMPGTLNYVEGQASVDGRALSERSVGMTQVRPNDVLTTTQGDAEVLLMPGVFLRVGNDSAIRMMSLGLADTTVGLEHGSAMLEVDQFYKENRLNVVVDNATTRIEKAGVYGFYANPPGVSVVDGKAELNAGSQVLTLKGGHQVALEGQQPLKAVRFNKEDAENDPLYRWSDLRSHYEAQANLDAAQAVGVNGGWYGAGWYWDPYWDCYAFLPGDGFLFSPFGWGFYSPFWAWGHGYYGGYPGRFGGVRGHFGGGFHGGGFHGGGFHGGGFGGGGFHGGGGGHRG